MAVPTAAIDRRLWLPMLAGWVIGVLRSLGLGLSGLFQNAFVWSKTRRKGEGETRSGAQYRVRSTQYAVVSNRCPVRGSQVPPVLDSRHWVLALGPWYCV